MRQLNKSNDNLINMNFCAVLGYIFTFLDRAKAKWGQKKF